MVLLLALATALAAPDGYKVTKEDVVGCTLMLGPKEADGVVPMRAECHWPDITLETFDRCFRAWDSHDEIFSTIETNEIVPSGQDGVVRVVQRQVTKGISDRFAVLDMRVDPLDGGGFDYHWSVAKDHGIEPLPNTVVTPRSDGTWKVRAASDGGVDVEYVLSYDPGGSVPGFLVRWFQTSGLAGIVTDVHTYMTTH